MSSSSSQSSAATNQSDNRRNIGQNGISAENSTVTIQTLDGQVVNRAFDSQDLTVKNALQFAGDSQDGAFSFGKSALSQISASQDKAYSFASEAGAQALDSLTTTSNLVKDAYADAKGRGAMTDQIMIGAIAMAGLVAFAAIRK